MGAWPLDTLRRQRRIWLANAETCERIHKGCACSTTFRRLLKESAHAAD